MPHLRVMPEDGRLHYLLQHTWVLGLADHAFSWTPAEPLPTSLPDHQDVGEPKADDALSSPVLGRD